MEHVQRVELLSGSGSLLGPNSLGGAVNLITRRGQGPLEAEAELSGGSYGSYPAKRPSVASAEASGITIWPAGTRTRTAGGRPPALRT